MILVSFEIFRIFNCIFCLQSSSELFRL